MGDKGTHEMSECRPFEDSDSVRTFGGLSVENGNAEIFIHGSLVLRKDRQSLRRAKEFALWLGEFAEALGDEAALPETAAHAGYAGPVQVQNPFG